MSNIWSPRHLAGQDELQRLQTLRATYIERDPHASRQGIVRELDLLMISLSESPSKGVGQQRSSYQSFSKPRSAIVSWGLSPRGPRDSILAEKQQPVIQAAVVCMPADGVEGDGHILNQFDLGIGRMDYSSPPRSPRSQHCGKLRHACL